MKGFILAIVAVAMLALAAFPVDAHAGCNSNNRGGNCNSSRNFRGNNGNVNVNVRNRRGFFGGNRGNNNSRGVNINVN